MLEREPVVFIGSEVRTVNDDMPLAHITIAFQGASWIDPDSIALTVLQTLLGNWNKSVGVSFIQFEVFSGHLEQVSSMASRFWTQGDSESEEEQSEIEEEENVGRGEIGVVVVGSNKYLQKNASDSEDSELFLIISVVLSDLQRTRGLKRCPLQLIK